MKIAKELSIVLDNGDSHIIDVLPLEGDYQELIDTIYEHMDGKTVCGFKADTGVSLIDFGRVIIANVKPVEK